MTVDDVTGQAIDPDDAEHRRGLLGHGDVKRIVLVGTACWLWPHRADHKDHLNHLETVLRQFVGAGGRTSVRLDGGTAGVIGTPGRPGPPAAGVEPRWNGLYPHALPEPVWARAADAPGWVDDTLQRVRASSEQLRDSYSSGPSRWEPAQQKLLETRARLFVPAPDLARLPLTTKHSPRTHLGIDLAFRSAHVERRVRFYCVASATFFSHHPHSTWYAPALEEDEDPIAPVAWQEWARGVHLKTWRVVRPLLTTGVERLRVVHDVRGRLFETPTFWTIATTPNARQSATVDDAARFLLGTRALDTPGVAPVTPQGGLHVVRRQRTVEGTSGSGALPETTFEIPTYLLVPCFSRRIGYAEQEECTAETILSLTALELQLAASLYDVDSDLEIYDNLARVYGTSAERATVLWDALAKHLPSAKHGGRAEKAIELIHLVMLQGVADLNVVANAIERADIQLRTELEQVREIADRTLAQRHATTEGLCDALTRSGYAAELTSQTADMSARLGRIRGDVTWLLQGISYAFDERRVRVTDQTARAGVGLASGVALFGFISLADLFLQFKIDLGPVVTQIPHGKVWVMSLCAVLAATGAAVLGLFIYRIRRRQRLGSAAFLKQWEVSRAYVERVSTLELDRRTRELGSWTDQAWRDLDADLARQLRDRWKVAYRKPYRIEPTSDLGQLLDDVEIWALQAILVTERTYKLYSYPLPELAALYYTLSVSGSSLLGEPLFGDPIAAVSRADMMFALRNAGFRKEEAGEIFRWLDESRHDDDVDRVHRRVAALELRHQMSAEDRSRALGIVGRPAITLTAVPGPGSMAGGEITRARVEVWDCDGTTWEMTVQRPGYSAGETGSARTGVELQDVRYRGARVLAHAHVSEVVLTASRVDGDRVRLDREAPYDVVGMDADHGLPGWCVCRHVPDRVPVGSSPTFLGVALHLHRGDLHIVSRFRDGRYQYVCEWRLAADGTITPRLGVSVVDGGSLEPTERHRVRWRLVPGPNGTLGGSSSRAVRFGAILPSPDGHVDGVRLQPAASRPSTLRRLIAYRLTNAVRSITTR